MATPSTTDALQVKDIQNGVVLLKDGSVRGIVQIDAINFELRSSEEQAAIIEQFQGFLNAIDFPVQAVVQSRKYNVETYLTGIQASAAQLTNDLLKLQAEEYVRFVRELSELSNIMSKHFYVVIPLQATTTATSDGGMLSGITGLFKKKPAATGPGLPEQEVQTYKLQLQQRADLVLGGLSGMGLKGKMLEQDDLVALFTDLYNPTVSSQPAQPTTPQPNA